MATSMTLGGLTLLEPIWLVLLLPLAVSLWVWRQPGRVLTVLRAVVYGLVLLALTQPVWRRPMQAGTVIVLADRSLSMPAMADGQQAQWLRVLNETRSRHDRLEVIPFGRSAVVEEVGREFTDIEAQVNPEASNYAAALEQAIARLGREVPGRIVVFGDGRWTGRDPAEAAATAASRSIGIDYRLLERPTTADVAIERIDAPARVGPEESFMLTGWVRVPVSQTVSYELRRGNTVIAEGERDLSAGLNRLTFRDRTSSPGVGSYRLTVRGGQTDPLPENNTARQLVGIDGPKPILHVTESADPTLAALLEAGGLAVAVTDPQQPNWTLEELANYAAVLLENVPAEEIGDTGMENLAGWVRQTGSGLMMTGGKRSFGPGGYYKSPLEPIMPVSMELRREHRKLALSIVIVMDRSGSMTAAASGGKTKMDLANLAAAEVVNLLGPNDEVGVIAVDSSPHTIVNRTKLDDPRAVRDRILKIDSRGGGIFVNAGLTAGLDMLHGSSLGTRHIILFADAQDSEQPGNYQQLIDTARRAGITISVIGLGTPSDVDAPLLRDIAKRGEGRVFFTQDAGELPRLFAQDTFVVARSTFIEEPTAVDMTAGMLPIANRRFDLDRALGGYNLTYLRPAANQAAVSVDEYRAPIIANHQVGAGRTLVYTGETDGDFTGPIADWPEIGALFTSLARWTMGDDQRLPSGAMLDQRVDGSSARVKLYLDPDRQGDPFQSLPTVSVLRGTPGGGAPETSERTMRWSGADELSLEIPLSGEETAIATVEVGDATVSLPPVSLMYSPEFAPVEPGAGRAALERLARATGGERRDVLPEVWSALPKQPRDTALAPWLLLLAVLVLIAEVFERRSGMLSAGAAARRRRALEQARAAGDEARVGEAPAKRARRMFKKRARRPAGDDSGEPSDSGAADAPKPDAPSDHPGDSSEGSSQQRGSMRDALTAARDRARGRTGRK